MNRSSEKFFYIYEVIADAKLLSTQRAGVYPLIAMLSAELAHRSNNFYNASEMRSKRLVRRLVLGIALAVLIHFLSFVFIAPYLSLNSEKFSRTEVTQISEQDLTKLREKILRQKQVAALIRQELHEELKSKEAPEDATMMAPFNQKVKKQMVAGAQAEAPLDGGGAMAKNASQKKQAQNTEQKNKQKSLSLSSLGLGEAIKTAPPEQQQRRAENSNQANPSPLQGPQGPYRPRGLDDKHLERGNQNLLNAAENQFYSFFARFDEPLVRNWYFLMGMSRPALLSEIRERKIQPGSEIPVTVEIELDRQGNFTRIDIIESSGLPTFDTCVRQAVKKLGSLQNPPPGLFEGKNSYVRQMTFALVINESISSKPDIYW